MHGACVAPTPASTVFCVSNDSELLVKEQRLFFIILCDSSSYDRKLSTAFDFRKTHFPPNIFAVGALIFYVGLVE